MRRKVDIPLMDFCTIKCGTTSHEADRRIAGYFRDFLLDAGGWI